MSRDMQGVVLVFARCRLGFSLLELIIVILIIGIISTISIPILLPTLRHSTLEGAADQLISTFATVRAQGISRNTYCQLTFSPGAGTFSVRQYNAETEEWETTEGPHSLPNTISFGEGGVTFPGAIATFDPHGSLLDSGTITLVGPTGETVTMRSILATGKLLRAED